MKDLEKAFVRVGEGLGGAQRDHLATWRIAGVGAECSNDLDRTKEGPIGVLDMWHARVVSFRVHHLISAE